MDQHIKPIRTSSILQFEMEKKLIKKCPIAISRFEITLQFRIGEGRKKIQLNDNNHVRWIKHTRGIVQFSTSLMRNYEFNSNKSLSDTRPPTKILHIKSQIGLQYYGGTYCTSIQRHRNSCFVPFVCQLFSRFIIVSTTYIYSGSLFHCSLDRKLLMKLL